MKRYLLGMTVLLAACVAGPARAAEKPLTLPVWPTKPPNETAALPPETDLTKPEENLIAGKRIIRLGNVSQPTLTVYRPAKEKDTGAAVVIAPGGGYHILALDLEGDEVAQWLNTIGVTGIVLKYRVPRRPGQGDEPPVAPLQDAQRSISLVRSKAKEWGIDPNRIGMLGFSAGGHLTAHTTTNSDRRSYEAIDEVDKVSSRPDFMVLIYPAYLTTKAADALAPEIRVTKDTPPTFMIHASDDPISPENSAMLYLALKRAKVPAELHIYTSGGHGYGLRRTEQPVTSWPQRLEEWLGRQGILKPAAAK